MTVSMKRSRDHADDREVENLAMANCLMLLSRRRLYNTNSNSYGQAADSFTGRVFRCKTCDREFQSFQALGGHRASHKRHKLISSDLTNHSPSSPSKPKTHACSICGLDFPLGQALGGHMRRHRGEKTAEENNIRLSPVAVPLIRKSVVSKEFLCLDLDLNLTPLENDLKLGNQAGPILQLGF